MNQDKLTGVDSSLARLANQVIEARIDRREFIWRAAILGVSASAAVAFLNACLGGTSNPTSASRTLTVGPLADYLNYDTTTNQYDFPYPPFSQIYEGLTTYVPGVGWSPVNLLADKITVSPDGLTYSFELKQGINFHKGFGEMTATDVKYSFERAAGIQPQWPNATSSEVSYSTADFPGLQQVNVTGKYTGDVIFKQPFVPFVGITLPFTTSGMIVSMKAVEHYGKAFPQNPVGTGPYEVTSYTPNQEMILKKFSGYGGAANQILPSYDFDEIRIVLTSTNATPSGAALTVPLQAGQVDFTPRLSGLDTQRLANDPSLTVYDAPQPLNQAFLCINVLHPKLQDPRVRNAIRYALDIPAIIQADGESLTTRLNAVIAPQMGYAVWPAAPIYQRDVAMAKSLLSEAGVTSLSLDLAPSGHLPGSPTDVMQVIQSNLRDVGIQVNILATEPTNYATSSKVGQLHWAVFGGGPDPYYQMEWFTCMFVDLYNYAFWCNHQYDGLLAQLGQVADQANRTQIAIQMQQLQDQSAGFVWTHYGVNHAASKTNIKAVFDSNGNPLLQWFKAV